MRGEQRQRVNYSAESYEWWTININYHPMDGVFLSQPWPGEGCTQDGFIGEKNRIFIKFKYLGALYTPQNYNISSDHNINSIFSLSQYCFSFSIGTAESFFIRLCIRHGNPETPETFTYCLKLLRVLIAFLSYDTEHEKFFGDKTRTRIIKFCRKCTIKGTPKVNYSCHLLAIFGTKYRSNLSSILPIALQYRDFQAERYGFSGYIFMVGYNVQPRSVHHGKRICSTVVSTVEQVTSKMQCS